MISRMFLYHRIIQLVVILNKIWFRLVLIVSSVIKRKRKKLFLSFNCQVAFLLSMHLDNWYWWSENSITNLDFQKSRFSSLVETKNINRLKRQPLNVRCNIYWTGHAPLIEKLQRQDFVFKTDHSFNCRCFLLLVGLPVFRLRFYCPGIDIFFRIWTFMLCNKSLENLQ